MALNLLCSGEFAEISGVDMLGNGRFRPVDRRVSSRQPPRFVSKQKDKVANERSMPSKPQKPSDEFKTMFGVAVRLGKLQDVDALLLWVEKPLKWEELPARPAELTVLVASDNPDNVVGANDNDLEVVQIDTLDAPVSERLSQALLEAIAEDILAPSAKVVAL